jgi:hypothetical protein
MKTTRIHPVIASGAKQSRAAKKNWIASSQELLAMTNVDVGAVNQKAHK